jgi:uncharacterized protein YebE (UPF0316 family)
MTAVIVTTLLIVLARIVDMSLDTVRTVSIVQGRRLFAACLGFIQALVYIFAIAKVLTDMSHPTYAIAYATGFALGTYLGIVVEQRLAFGNQLASLYTSKGAELARALTTAGYRVAQVHEHLRDIGGGEGLMSIVYVELPRRQVRMLIRDAADIDERCYYVVNDVRIAGFAPQHAAAGEHRPRHPRGEAARRGSRGTADTLDMGTSVGAARSGK